MKISVKSDLEAVAKGIAQDHPRAYEIATQRALIGTAHEIRKDERATMQRVFDRPTPWTLNAFEVTFDRPNMAAKLAIKDGYWYRADNYLQTQIEGGQTRKSKAFESALRAVGVLPIGWFAVPGQRAKLDAFGNQSPGEIRQILSYFDAAERIAGSTQNMGVQGRARRLRGTKKRAGWEYFVVRPGDRRSFVRSNGKTGKNKAQPGIYRRTNLALGSRIEPIVIFVPRATYKPIFDFYGVAQRTIDRDMSSRFESALIAELAREAARAKP